MASRNSYRILGLHPGAGEKEVKSAYRALAKEYHPDINNTPGAKRKFQELKNAYQDIVENGTIIFRRDPVQENVFDYLRRERAKTNERVKREEERRREKDEKFRSGIYYNLLLIAQYVLHGAVIIVGCGFIALPFILAVKTEPAIFAATFYFVIIGVFILWYVFSKRRSWFRLGSFNNSFRSLLNVGKRK